MPFEKSPAELVARFDELADLAPEAARKLMFGFPSLVLGGHMFMGLYEDHLVARLGADDRGALMDVGISLTSNECSMNVNDWVS